MNIRRFGALCLTCACWQLAVAGETFLPANNLRLRDDLTLLADRGLIRLPVDEWPLPRADVARAIAGIDAADLHDPALEAALSRVAAATASGEDAAEWKIRSIQLTAGQPGLLRGFDTLGREDAELTSTGGAATDRYGLTLALTGAAHPADGHDLRLDGSDASLRWGNWLLSVNQLGRWWGPGIEGSLILSTNARPMPAISLDRLHSLAPGLPWLHWVGPWRFSWFFGLGEAHRADIDRPLFMGMRLSIKPASFLEFGVSRSAQFCGKGRLCDAGTFWRMLIGRDNTGLRGLNNPVDEPGNQMSGFDLRLASPWKALPLAVYAQAIGEDNSDFSLPIRYLMQTGAQAWWDLAGGAVLRAYVEHADTADDIYEFWRVRDPSGATTDYAYRNHLFFAGYRYYGRNIGHTTDADSLSTAVGLSLTTAGGTRWAVQWLGARLDRRGAPDIYNSLTYGPSRYHSLQLSWDGRLAGQDIGFQIGHERQTPSAAGNANGLFGFVQWRKALQ